MVSLLQGSHANHDCTCTIQVVYDLYNQAWIITAIKRLARRKKKAFIKHRATKRDKDKQRLIRLEKEMTRETRCAFNSYLKEILDPTTYLKAKRLYSYVKSQKKDSSCVGPLRGSDGQTYSSPEKKANILNDQFSYVFNVADDTDMSELKPSPYDAMPSIDIHVNGDAKLLRGLKAHKATGHDEVPASQATEKRGSRSTRSYPDDHIQGLLLASHHP